MKSDKEPCSFCQEAIIEDEKNPSKSILELILDRDTVRFYRCKKCKTVWYAADIPYGGLYGDVDWTNISMHCWRDHWFWKTDEGKRIK